MTTRPYKINILLLFSVLFLLSRIIFLDSDLPPWDIFNYQPIDELYYSTTAFNIYHYGEIAHKIVPYIESDSSTENMLGNLLTSLTLFLFGNNYFGLRMSAVLAAFFVFIAMYFTLKNYVIYNGFLLFPENKHNLSLNSDLGEGLGFSKNILFFVMTYMLCDFSFLLAARVMEPTIFRTIPLMAFLWFFSSKTEEETPISTFSSMSIGFFSLVSVFYVYPTNFFLIPSLFFICLWMGRKNGFKEVAVNLLAFLFGCGLGFLSYELTLRILFETSYFNVVNEIYTIFTQRLAFPIDSKITFSITSILIKINENMLGMFSTNFFRFNILLLFAFVVSLPIFFCHVFQRKETKDIFLLFVTLFLVLQTLFINDYFYRKFIIALPLVLLIIARSMILAKTFLTQCKEKKIFLYLYASYNTLGILFAHSILLRNGSEQIVGYDALKEDFPVLLTLLFTQLFFAIITLRTKRYLLRKGLIIATWLLILSPNIFFAAKYIYIAPTYSYKNTMLQMGEYTNNEIVLGGLAHGFRLYNTSIPILNLYRYQYAKNGLEKYFELQKRVGKETRAHFNIAYTSSLGTQKYRFEIIKTFELEYKVKGIPESISLVKLNF